MGSLHPRAASRIPLVFADRLPALRCPQLDTLRTAWTERWQARRCGRRDFPPETLQPLLPWLWLYDRIDGRWFCRLAGEEVRYQNGRQIHRRWLEEFVPGAGAGEVQAYFDAIADRPGVGYVFGPIWIAMERHIQGERLCYPLWTDAPIDGPADGLIGATIPLPDLAASETDPRRLVVPLR
ncbi:MAG: PAS domain-containing protein [Alphaproteobacteria bacterium]|jgi:hypothetical protein|nr:PAS domain-containing protein [Alphaproteobacteria bacterium]